MERVREQMLELLRCGTWGLEPNLELFEGEVDWKLIFNQAGKQAVLGTVYTQVERLKGVELPDRATYMYFHKLITLNRKIHLHMDQVIEKVMSRLIEAGIERPVLLKGAGVAKNYLDPGARQCGDIDIYVGKKHYKRSLEITKSWDESIFENDALSIKHYHFLFEGIHIEIHRIAISESDVTANHSKFQQWCEDELEGDRLRREKIGGYEVYLPPYTFDAFYIFYHAWSHFCHHGIGFRQLCDWCRFMIHNSEKVDQDELLERLEYFGLVTPWNYFSAVTIKYLGMDPSKVVAYDSSREWPVEKMVEKIWHGGNFGFYSDKRAGAGRSMIARKFINFVALYYCYKFLYSIDRRYSYNFLLHTPITIIKSNFFQLYGAITKRVI